MDNISEKEQMGILQMQYEYEQKKIVAKGEQDRMTEETKGEQARKTEKLKAKCKVASGALLLGIGFGLSCLSDYLSIPKKKVREYMPPIHN